MAYVFEFGPLFDGAMTTWAMLAVRDDGRHTSVRSPSREHARLEIAKAVESEAVTCAATLRAFGAEYGWKVARPTPNEALTAAVWLVWDDHRGTLDCLPMSDVAPHFLRACALFFSEGWKLERPQRPFELRLEGPKLEGRGARIACVVMEPGLGPMLAVFRSVEGWLARDLLLHDTAVVSFEGAEGPVVDALDAVFGVGFRLHVCRIEHGEPVGANQRDLEELTAVMLHLVGEATGLTPHPLHGLTVRTVKRLEDDGRGAAAATQ